MKKEVIIGSTLILLVATPALAAPQNGRADQAPRNEKAVQVLSERVDSGEVAEDIEETHTLTATPTATPMVTIVPEEEVNEGRGKANGKAKANAKTNVQEVRGQETCDLEADWKNHGAYVSCVARTHPGGEVVSAAARSEVGKKTVEATPSATPTVTPTPTDDPEAPITSAETEFSLNPVENIQALVKRLEKLVSYLKNLV